MREFENTNNLPIIIVGCRLSVLDSYCLVSHAPRLVPIGDHWEERDFIRVDSSVLTDLQISNELSYVLTAAETAALIDFANSVANFNAIPDWATKSASDLVAAVNQNFFGGDSLDTLHTQINGINTFPKAIAAFTRIVDQMFANKDRELKEIQSIAALRDYLIRLRKLASSQQTPNRA